MLPFSRTTYSFAGFAARLTIALVLFPHGAQKMLGWWNGLGFSGAMSFFTGTVHLPYVIGVLVIWIEFFCPLLLLIGLATRLNAFAVLVVMAGIIATVQHQYFFMNWFGNQSGEGMEFFLLVIGLCTVCLVTGGGSFSLDHYMQYKKL
jgi:putative oxidoreductase